MTAEGTSVLTFSSGEKILPSSSFSATITHPQRSITETPTKRQMRAASCAYYL